MMFKFREDIELIKCDLKYGESSEYWTDVRSITDGVIGPWMIATAMVDHSDFPGPVYRDKDGNGIKHAITIYNGDYLVKADGHIFYGPLQLLMSLLQEIK